MLKIGLTGGIGSGKTTVCQLFSELGVPIIDADVIAHTLTGAGQPLLEPIREVFGSNVFDDSNHLNRKKLADIIFTTPKKRQQLEKILHPAIRAEIKKQIQQLDTHYCILAIPLLLETQNTDLVDKILVIDCSFEIRISRLEQRDGLTADEINDRFDAQIDRNNRLEQADDIIVNDGSMEKLKTKVLDLHRFYLQQSVNNQT